MSSSRAKAKSANFDVLYAPPIRVSNHDPGDEDPATEHEADYGLTEDVVREALRQGREESDLARGRVPFRTKRYL